MAKQENGPAPGYAQPAFQLKVCPFCGMPAYWKFDKKGRPYHSCGFCQTKLFIYGHVALSGIEVLHEMVIRSGIPRFRQAVQTRAMRRIQRAPTSARRNGQPPR